MRKRILSLITFAVIIMGLMNISPHGLAAFSTCQIPLSNNPEEKTTIILQGKSLLIRSLPNSVEYNFIIIKLVGDHQILPAKKCKNTRKLACDVKFNLRDVPNGSYYVEIFYASQRYAMYTSYLGEKSLRIRVSDSSVEFAEPVTLPGNRAVFASNPRDQDTLNLYLAPSEKVESNDQAILDLAGAITSEASADYDKAKAIHDWVSQNIWYNYDELNSGISKNRSALETLSSQTGVCVDFASLTAALLRAVHIPAKLVTGYILDTSSHEIWPQDLTAIRKGNHVWNEAYIDGRWIIIDTSYDTNNTFVHGKFSIGTGLKNRKYFDITIEGLSTDRYILPKQLDPLAMR